MDKVTTALMEGLKKALATPGEQRLFRSGKLPGIFPSRRGANAQAAQRALDEGMLEVVRIELRGRQQRKWVRPTARAIEFVHAHDTPTAAIQELQHILQTTQLSLPVWIADFQKRLADLSQQVVGHIEKIGARLDALCTRVEQSLLRAEAERASLPSDVEDLVPWAAAILEYLDRRLEAGIIEPCPLSELFTVAREKEPSLGVGAFHTGIRRLFDRGLLRLVAHREGDPIPTPEFALLDGLTTYYCATRGGVAA